MGWIRRSLGGQRAGEGWLQRLVQRFPLPSVKFDSFFWFSANPQNGAVLESSGWVWRRNVWIHCGEPLLVSDDRWCDFFLLSFLGMKFHCRWIAGLGWVFISFSMDKRLTREQAWWAKWASAKKRAITTLPSTRDPSRYLLTVISPFLTMAIGCWASFFHFWTTFSLRSSAWISPPKTL